MRYLGSYMYLLTNLPTYLPTYQTTNLPNYQPTKLPTYLLTYLHKLLESDIAISGVRKRASGHFDAKENYKNNIFANLKTANAIFQLLCLDGSKSEKIFWAFWCWDLFLLSKVDVLDHSFASLSKRNRSIVKKVHKDLTCLREHLAIGLVGVWL